MNFTGFFSGYLGDMIDAMGVQEGLYIWAKNLGELFGCNKILCFSYNSISKLSNIILSYAKGGDESFTIDRYSVLRNFSYSEAERTAIAIDKEHMIFIENNVAKNQRFLNEAYGSFSAYIGINFNDCNNGDIFYTVLFTSDTKIFDEGDVDALITVKPYLRYMLERYLLDNPATYLNLLKPGQSHSGPESMLRSCPGLRGAMRMVESVASQKTSVFLYGPSGSGKELFADTIHALSPRFERPMIKVNCSAIPESLFESEMFGYERGAFTGAVSAHPGFFEQAQGGTLYLDEIGDLSLAAQIRLLRVLENKEVRRIGSKRFISLDVRIISATNRDIPTMVQEGKFREDLWYRLNIFPIVIPGLDKRKEDIPILLEYYYNYYVAELQMKNPPRLTESLMRQSMEMHWPGNVRQLRHMMERSLLICKASHMKVLRFYDDAEGVILANHVSTGKAVAEVTSQDIKQGSHYSVPDSQDKAIGISDIVWTPKMGRGRPRQHAFTEQEIQDALHASMGKISGKGGAAEMLKCNPQTLRSIIKKMGL